MVTSSRLKQWDRGCPFLCFFSIMLYHNFFKFADENTKVFCVVKYIIPIAARMPHNGVATVILTCLPHSASGTPTIRRSLTYGASDWLTVKKLPATRRFHSGRPIRLSRWSRVRSP